MRRFLLVIGALVLATALAGGALYVGNAAPTAPAISDAEAADATKPFVVKLHAQWCHKCLLTQHIWTSVEKAYGARVKLAVFDFTNDETTERSRTEATRLGLRALFDEYNGVSGAVVVLNGHTKEIVADIDGSRDFSEYQRAIDSALRTN